MKPIREQLRDQARAIEAVWATRPAIRGWTRSTTITLESRAVPLPAKLLLSATGWINEAEVCDVPAGRLLFVGAESAWIGGTALGQAFPVDEGAGMGRTFPIDIHLRLGYRDADWNYAVDRDGRLVRLGDWAGCPLRPYADFDALLDVLGPPDDPTPDGPPSGSWRTRPSLL